jgi:hypothetical protein
MQVGMCVGMWGMYACGYVGVVVCGYSGAMHVGMYVGNMYKCVPLDAPGTDRVTIEALSLSFDAEVNAVCHI